MSAPKGEPNWCHRILKEDDEPSTASSSSDDAIYENAPPSAYKKRIRRLRNQLLEDAHCQDFIDRRRDERLLYLWVTLKKRVGRFFQRNLLINRKHSRLRSETKRNSKRNVLKLCYIIYRLPWIRLLRRLEPETMLPWSWAEDWLDNP